MSCRPSRDFPSLSNKIPGEQAAGFGRPPAGDPPSPARTPGSPRPSSNGFPGEGLSTPAYSCPGLWESQTPCLPTKDGSPAPTPQANHHPSSGLLEACFPRRATKHRPGLTSAHTLLGF